MWYPSYAYSGSSYHRIDGLSVSVCLAIAECLHGCTFPVASHKISGIKHFMARKWKCFLVNSNENENITRFIPKGDTGGEQIWIYMVAYIYFPPGAWGTVYIVPNPFMGKPTDRR